MNIFKIGKIWESNLGHFLKRPEKGMKWNKFLSKAEVPNTYHKLICNAALEKIRWLMEDCEQKS